MPQDFGLQDHLRGLLQSYAPQWLQPALAVTLHVPPAADSLATLLAVLLPGATSGRGASAPRERRTDEARRAALFRLVSLIVLLDDVATADAPPPTPCAPPLLRIDAPHSSTLQMLQQLQKACLAKQGDVCIRLRRLGARLAYARQPIAAAPLFDGGGRALSLLGPAADPCDGRLLH
eukprot:2133471-Prymnesium_polylepis.1